MFRVNCPLGVSIHRLYDLTKLKLEECIRNEANSKYVKHSQICDVKQMCFHRVICSCDVQPKVWASVEHRCIQSSPSGHWRQFVNLITIYGWEGERGWNRWTMVEKRVPDEKDFEGGDVLWWDGIAVFPNASKLAKLVCELLWDAAAMNKGKQKQTMEGQCMAWWQTHTAEYHTALVFLVDRLRDKQLTWLAWKMCKVGKVGGAGSLCVWSSKDVSSQVREQVKLLLLSSAVGLGTNKPWRLEKKNKRGFYNCLGRDQWGEQSHQHRTSGLLSDCTQVVTWRSGVLLSCRLLRGWTSGVLPVLLAEEPDTEAWTLATALAWSGGTYLYIHEKAPTQA